MTLTNLPLCVLYLYFASTSSVEEGKFCHHKNSHIVFAFSVVFVICVYFLWGEGQGGVSVGTGWFNFESPHCSNFWATITIVVTTDVSIATTIRSTLIVNIFLYSVKILNAPSSYLSPPPPPAVVYFFKPVYFLA